MDAKSKFDAIKQEFRRAVNSSETYTVTYTLPHFHNISRYIIHYLRTDVLHSKSGGRKAVWVRFPPPAPFLVVLP
jgi:hypothetical protein